jgi:hypothetical protein
MVGLVPTIHVFFLAARPTPTKKIVDGRHKADHDD